MSSIWNKPKSKGGPSHKKGAAAEWRRTHKVENKENPELISNKKARNNETQRIKEQVTILRRDPHFKYMYGISNENPNNNSYKGFLMNGGKTRKIRKNTTKRHKRRVQ
jgi:hypothetical protein